MTTFRKNILTRVVLSLCLLLVFGSAALVSISLKTVHKRQSGISKDIERIINRYAESEARGLFSQLALLAEDSSLANAWSAKDFTRLSSLSRQRLSRLKATYNTTHLYLITPDGTVYFRAHQPEHRFDQIKRASFIKTRRTGIPSYGIELSSLGRLSLRAVAPWYIGEKLVGYLEVAKEIDQLVTELGALESMGVAIHLKRSALTDNQIKEIISARNLQYTVNNFPEHFLLVSTTPELARHAGTMLDMPMRMSTFLRKTLTLDHQTACAWSDIHDMNGRNVALVHVLLPISHELTLVRIGIAGILVGGAFLTVLIGLAFSRYLHGLEHSLKVANAERDRYHELTDHYIPLASVSKAGVIKHTNFAFAQLLGITPESLQKDSLLGFVAQDDVALSRDQILHLLEEHKDWEGEVRFRRPGQADLWAFVQASVGLDSPETQLTILDISDRKQIEQMAMTDALTGLLNRRAFMSISEREFRTALRRGEPITCAMLDIDHFKKYNDIYGHQAGDQALQVVSSTLQSVLKRSQDFLFRMGGEEFLVLSNGTDCTQFSAILESIRSSIEHLDIIHTGNPPSQRLTISIGFACCAAADLGQTSPEVLYKAADDQLYLAKSSGRNQVKGVDQKSKPA